MIKFRCPHCDQKLGVPDEYAGRRVRCSRCEEPSKVPQPEMPVLEEVAVAPEVEAVEEAGGGISADDMFSNDMWDDLGASVEADPEEEARQEAIVAARSPRKKIKTVGVGPSSKGSSEPSAAMEFAKGAGRVPLAIGAAIVFPLVGGIIWGLIARATGFIFCWGAVPIACLAALGLTMFIKSRNVGIGLLAVLFGFVGIIEGKICIAKMAGMHELRKLINEGLQEEMEQAELTDVDVDEMLQEEWPLFAVATIHLMEEGEFEKEFVGEIFKAHLFDERREDLADALDEADQKVNAAIDGWSDAERRQKMKEKWPSVVANSAQLFMDSKLGSAIGMGLAFIGSFALWDLLFIPMALWSAFKIGDGRE